MKLKHLHTYSLLIMKSPSSSSFTFFPRSLRANRLTLLISILYFISDPRVKDWFLMSGPFPTMCICATYVLIVKVIGPKFMENRKPFVLRKTLIVYNFLQVIFSTWLFYEVIICILFDNKIRGFLTELASPI